MKIIAGPAPRFTMKLHIMNHQKLNDQLKLDCPVKGCIDQVRTPYNYCHFPLEYYEHIENKHNISFQDYKLTATLTCKICLESLLLHSRRPNISSMLPSAKAYVERWGKKLTHHINSAHGMDLADRRTSWAEYFKREVSLVQIVDEELSFVEKMLRVRKCAMMCDFSGTSDIPYYWRKKILKHYCTDHFSEGLFRK